LKFVFVQCKKLCCWQRWREAFDTLQDYFGKNWDCASWHKTMLSKLCGLWFWGW